MAHIILKVTQQTDDAIGAPEIRRLRLARDAPFKALSSALSKTFGLPGADRSFKLHWVDSDGDHITVKSDLDWDEAKSAAGHGLLKLTISQVHSQVANVTPTTSTAPRSSRSSQRPRQATAGVPETSHDLKRQLEKLHGETLSWSEFYTQTANIAGRIGVDPTTAVAGDQHHAVNSFLRGCLLSEICASRTPNPVARSNLRALDTKQVRSLKRPALHRAVCKQIGKPHNRGVQQCGVRLQPTPARTDQKLREWLRLRPAYFRAVCKEIRVSALKCNHGLRSIYGCAQLLSRKRGIERTAARELSWSEFFSVLPLGSDAL